MKNLPIGVVGPVHHGGGGLILQTERWLGFRRGAGGRLRMNKRAVYGYKDVLICSPKEHVAMSVVVSSGPLLLGIIVATCILPHQSVATVIIISNGSSGVSRAHCYCDLYIYIAFVFP
jgi:hypothetical protein